MAKYRKKPVVIDAEFFDQDKVHRLSDEFHAAICRCTSQPGQGIEWHIHTLEGGVGCPEPLNGWPEPWGEMRS